MKKTLTLYLSLFIFSCISAQDTMNFKAILPSVQVKTLDGKPVNIQSAITPDKITVLFFWETFCGPSIKGLDNVLENYDDWQKNYNCELIGINVDDARNNSKVKPFVNGRGWPFTFYTDENKDLTRALNIPTCPYLLILDRQGHIVYRHIGFAEGYEGELELQLKRWIKP